MKLEDIDTERELTYIKGGKGRKDRYTLLSDVTIETLSLYLKLYQPKKWLFPGQSDERPITTRTVQRIFEDACCQKGRCSNKNHHKNWEHT